MITTNPRISLTNLSKTTVEHPEAVKGGIIGVLIGDDKAYPDVRQFRSDIGQKPQFQLNEANSMFS